MVFTGVVAASTLIYAGFTGWLACETRKVRKAQTEPRVGVRVSLVDGSRMILEIRNQGQGLAKPESTDGRREESGRGVRELQGK